MYVHISRYIHNEGKEGVRQPVCVRCVSVSVVSVQTTTIQANCYDQPRSVSSHNPQHTQASIPSCDQASPAQS